MIKKAWMDCFILFETYNVKSNLQTNNAYNGRNKDKQNTRNIKIRKNNEIGVATIPLIQSRDLLC